MLDLRTGVLLIQLGTPDSPDPRALRRFLREFLGDPHVVDLPAPVRTALLEGVILPLRPRRSAAAYRKIWTQEGSPLLVHSRALRAAVERELGRGYVVELGMRYGRPSLRGRALSLLVPHGQVWRTGANDATQLTTDRALRFRDVALPAGTYSLFTLPSATGWTLIINRATGASGLDYDAAQDHARIAMDVETNAPHTEQFTIDVEQTAAGGVLRLRWGTVRATAPFTVSGD